MSILWNFCQSIGFIGDEVFFLCLIFCNTTYMHVHILCVCVYLVIWFDTLDYIYLVFFFGWMSLSRIIHYANMSKWYCMRPFPLDVRDPHVLWMRRVQQENNRNKWDRIWTWHRAENRAHFFQLLLLHLRFVVERKIFHITRH